MTTVPMPVRLYDVQTTAATPRVLLTFTRADAAQQFAVQLNALAAGGQIVGGETFAAAPPRTETVNATLQSGTSVLVQGFEVDVDATAAILIANATPTTAGGTPA